MSGVRDQRAKRQPAGRWYQCPGCWSGSFNRMTSDGYECECGERLFIIDLRDTEPSPFRPATPAAGDGSLDVAWREAEEALPEGWAINLLWGTVTSERWGANAGPWPSKPGDPQTFGGGDTPAAALRELAARLSESPSEGKTE